MTPKSLITLLFLTSKLICYSQIEVSALVKDYMNAVIQKQSTTELFNKILKSDNLETFYAIVVYTSDSVATSRSEAYNLLFKVGYYSQSVELRKKVVKHLIKGCRDKDAGICGNILSNLSLFKVNDFDQESVYELTSLAKENIPYLPKLIRITGFVNASDLELEYQKMLSDKKINGQTRWAIHLALARMGEESEIDYCVNKVKKLKINDDVVYDIVPDLIYLHKKKAFDYLFEIIQSDEKNCSSGNPDSNAKIICAYRVIGQIAPHIEKFPVETNVSGEIKTNDYAAALVNVREWIKTNIDSYTINTNIF